VSFFNISKSIPTPLMKLSIHNSVYRMSKKMYFMRKPRIVDGSPGIEI
jgi:hypothetical protein